MKNNSQCKTIEDLKNKRNRGVTLIALVVTIVVLLIIATVSVNTVFNEGGIINTSKVVADTYKIENYKSQIDMTVLSENVKYVMDEDTEKTLIDRTKNEISKLDFVKEVQDGDAKNELKIITNEPYLIIAQINDDGSTDINHAGIYDDEPLAQISLSVDGVKENVVRIKASATVETTEKTTDVSTLKLCEPEKVIENYNDGEEVIFEVIGSGKYTFEAITNLGKSIKKSIEVEANELVEVELGQSSYVYDGTEKKPSVTVKKGDLILTSGKNYNVSYKNNINAGEAQVIITGIGTHSEIKETKTFTINKAENTIIVTANTLDYTEAEQNLVTVKNAQGDVYYSVTAELTENNYLSEGSKTIPTAIIPGNYKVYYYTNGNENYNKAGGSVISKVQDAKLTGSVTIKGINKYGQELQAEVVNPNNASLEYKWYSNANNSVTGGTVIEGATSAKYTIGTGLVGKYIYVEVTMTKQYYETKIIADITDSINNETETTITKEIESPKAETGLVYNGEKQIGVIEGENYTVTTEKAIDAGNYTAVVTLKDKANTVWKDTNNNSDKTVSWTISAKSVAVTWGTTTSFTYNGKEQAPTATVTSGVTGETINVTRTTGTNAGSYTSTASISSVTGGQAKTSNYTLTGNTKSFTITKATNPISVAAVTGLKYGSTANLITASGAQGTVYYNVGTAATTSSSTTIPTASGKNAGTYVVYYYVAGNTNYAEKSGNVSVTIGKTNGYVTLDANKTVTYGTASTTFAVKTNHGGTLSVSDDNATAAVSISGTTVTVNTLGALAAGTTVKVTVTSAATTNYNSASATYTLTIGKAANTISVAAVTGLKYGSTANLITASGAQGTVYYNVGSAATTSSSTTIPTASGRNAGTYVVYYNVVGNTNYEAKTGSVSVTIGKTNGYVTLDANKTVTYGTASTTFAVKTNHGGTLSVSDDNATAGVSISGTTVTVSALGTLTAGTVVKVTVTSATTTNYNAASATYTLTIGKAANTISVAAVTGLKYGSTANLITASGAQGTVYYNVGTAATTSSSTTIPTASGRNAGTYVVYYNVVGNTNYEAKTGSVSVTIGKTNGYVTLDANKTVTYGTASTTFAVKTNHGGTLSVSDDNATAGVSISGTTVTVSALGTLTAGTVVKVTVTSATTTNYNAASATYTLTIGKAANTISVAAVTGLKYGSTANLVTVSGAQGTVYYNVGTAATTSSSTTIPTASGRNAGTYVVYYNVVGNTNYEAKTGSVSVTIGKTNGYVTLDANKTVTYGTASTTFAVKTNHGGTLSVSDDNATAGVSISGTTVTVSALGTLTAGTVVKVTVTSATTTNYNSASATYTLTIGRATTATATAANKTYTGSAQTGVTGSNVTWSGTTSSTNAGTYSATATPTANYAWSDGTYAAKTISWKINAKSVAVTWGSTTSFTYTGAAQAPTATATSGVTGETITVTRTTGTNAGSYTSTASISSVIGGQAKTSNYTLTGNTKAFTIGRATSATASAANKTYTGSAQTGVTGSNVTWTGTTSATDAGSYTATATPTANYAWSDGTYVAKTINWTMSAKAITVPSSPTAKTYSGASQAHGVTVPSGASIVTTGTTTSAINVGTYNVVLQLSSTTNYKWSDNTTTNKTISWKINAKSVAVAWGSTTSFKYTGSAQAPTATATSGVTGETITVTRTTGTNAGSYTSTASISSVTGGQAKTSNYTLTGNTKAFTIGRATTATATAANKTYTGSAQTGVTGSNVTWTGTTSVTDAGSYTATATPTANYAWSDGTYAAKTISWKINAKSVAVAWGSTTSFKYTGSAQAPTATATSGVTGETITVTRTTGTNAGSYTSTASISSVTGGQAKTSNYTLTGNTKAFTIGRATSATASAANKTYTGSAQTGVTGSNVTWSGTTSSTNAGTYSATATPTANYAWSDGTYAAKTINWTMSAKAITVPSSPTAKTYSGASQAHGVTVPSGASIVTTGTTTSAINVGTYNVVLQLSNTTNYKWSDNTTTAKTISWKINAKSVAVTWGSTTSFTYTGAAQAPTATATSGVTGETITVTRTTGTNAGSYTATASISSVTGGQAKTSNYTLTGNTKAFTIGRATTATATAANKTYTGSAQTGVTGSNVTWSGTTSSTNAGTYSATATPTANYAWSDGTYVAKTINWTMSAKAITVPSSPTAKTYSGASQAHGVTVPSGASIVTTGTTTSAINVGTYNVVLQLSSTTNYKWSDNTTTNKTISWKINAKSVAVTWGSTTSFTYTGAAQAPTATATSGVTGETITVTRTTGTNAGSYTATASISSVTGGQAKTSNYTLTGNTKTFTIGRATAATAAAANKTYTGSAQTGVTGTNVTWTGTTSATAVGTYTATATPTANYAWSDGTYAAKNISWTMIAPVYTITLDNQSATSAGTATIYEKCTVGWYSNSAATTSMTKITIPSKTGYTFGGYYTATGGTGTQVIKADGTIASANSTFKANTTIYAKWQAKTVVVTFMRNTSSTDTTSATQTFTYGVTGQSFSAKGWTKTGYTLLGWSADKNATAKTYSTTSGVSDGWIQTNAPAVTLYAVWQSNNTAPTAPTTSVSTRDASSFTVSAKSTDSNSDSLTYKLYAKTSAASTYSLVATSASTASGTAVSLKASSLASYTVYNYYVTVTDGKATTNGTASTTGTACDEAVGGASHAASYCDTGYVSYHTCNGSGCWCGCTATAGQSHSHGIPSPCSHGIPAKHYYCTVHNFMNIGSATCPGNSTCTCSSCTGKKTLTCSAAVQKTVACGGTLSFTVVGAGPTSSGSPTWTCSVCGQLTGTEWNAYPSATTHLVGDAHTTTKYVCTTHNYTGTTQSHTYTTACDHGYTTAHYYCTTHGYVGTESTHKYCQHGKMTTHYPN